MNLCIVGGRKNKVIFCLSGGEKIVTIMMFMLIMAGIAGCGKSDEN